MTGRPRLFGGPKDGDPTAPDLWAGLLQLNVRIPDGAPTGDAVSLVLTIGGPTSQPGVTVALH
jgi:uncharacterized protein (TIGR03437 family)